MMRYAMTLALALGILFTANNAALAFLGMHFHHKKDGIFEKAFYGPGWDSFALRWENN